MLDNLISKIKNIIFRAVISKIVSHNEVQYNYFNSVRNSKSIDVLGIKTIPLNETNCIILNLNADNRNAQHFAVNDNLDELVSNISLQSGETLIYNQKNENYVLLKNDGSVKIKSDKIILIGENEAVIKGTSFLNFFNGHTHTSASPGSPTTPPINPMTQSLLSQKVTIE